MTTQIKERENKHIDNCGICRKSKLIDMTNTCRCCSIQCCNKCIDVVLISKYTPVAHVYITSRVSVCVLCKILHENKINYDKSTIYQYCYSCNEIYDKCHFGLNRCITCIADDKPELDRKTLPHYKAKALIEEYMQIKDIAQIIYDYYYIPRRYLPNEF